MQYWLRRNNIDKGPFTKEALLSQGLQTTDLIKVDGGTEWKPLTGYQELMTAFQSQPKPKYKFTADKQLIEIKEDAQSTATPPKPQSPLGTVSQKNVTAQGQPNSPFKRMPSALPKKKTTITPPADHSQIQATEKAKERAKIIPPVKEASPDSTPSANSHSNGLHNGPQIGNAEHGPKVPARVQNLDEAPLRELRHHPTAKPVHTAAPPRNSHFFKEFFLPILIIGGIGFLAWWGYKHLTGPSSLIGTTSNTDSLELLAQQAGKQADSPGNLSAANEGPAAIPVKSGAVPKHDGQDSLAATVNKNTAALKDSSRAKVTVKPAAGATTAPVTPPSVKPAAAASDTQNGADNAAAAKTALTQTTAGQTDTPAASVAAKKEPEKKVEKKAPVKKAAAIGDYVNLSLNKTPEPGIKNVKIKVNNTSGDDLNIAVIEIKYFDKTGKFIQGETLQTGKISAGKSATLKVPSSKNAEKISYKVSLISGDNVYLMGR